ncbi:MAG: hypothetical protein ACI83Y_002675 [Candidatus Azotimanducaceae bacterium]|jgi:hypothetical protein
MLVVLTPRTVRGSGSKFPLCDLAQDVDVERLVRDQLFESRVFALQLFESFGVVGFHAAVLGDPAVPGRFGDLEMATYLVEFLTGRQLFLPSASFRMICSGV